ncbi:hypothetical protein LuPra_02706 [Luteitalea pratensis]|uniref:Uncharacterized protein n=2 Tax=Luteitalea pratensis TaxID=1855912 RepID=A0A143PNY3_LUTPR|nr:hypothetical protein LuPra_02706 [Luteitalea pratensis]
MLVQDACGEYAALQQSQVASVPPILDGLAEPKLGEHLKTTLPAIGKMVQRTGLSHSQFSALLGPSVRTLHERGRDDARRSGGARTLLIIAAKNPRALVDVA